jgi:hypothetical protein
MTYQVGAIPIDPPSALNFLSFGARLNLARLSNFIPINQQAAILAKLTIGSAISHGCVSKGLIANVTLQKCKH